MIGAVCTVYCDIKCKVSNSMCFEHNVGHFESFLWCHNVSKKACRIYFRYMFNIINVCHESQSLVWRETACDFDWVSG